MRFASNDTGRKALSRLSIIVLELMLIGKGLPGDNDSTTSVNDVVFPFFHAKKRFFNCFWVVSSSAPNARRITAHFAFSIPPKFSICVARLALRWSLSRRFVGDGDSIAKTLRLVYALLVLCFVRLFGKLIFKSHESTVFHLYNFLHTVAPKDEREEAEVSQSKLESQPIQIWWHANSYCDISTPAQQTPKYPSKKQRRPGAGLIGLNWIKLD